MGAGLVDRHHQTVMIAMCVNWPKGGQPVHEWTVYIKDLYNCQSPSIIRLSSCHRALSETCRVLPGTTVVFAAALSLRLGKTLPREGLTMHA